MRRVTVFSCFFHFLLFAWLLVPSGKGEVSTHVYPQESSFLRGKTLPGMKRELLTQCGTQLDTFRHYRPYPTLCFYRVDYGLLFLSGLLLYTDPLACPVGSAGCLAEYAGGGSEDGKHRKM